MLWLACHHHIMEIMLKAVVLHAIGYSFRPYMLLFKRFKKAGNTIQLEHFETIISNAFTLNQIKHIFTDTMTFALKQIEEFHPKDDFKELMNLSITILKGVPKKIIYFRAPDGFHRAR